MSTDRVIEWLIALGAGAVLLEIVRSLFLRKKMGADYADVISAAAVRLLAPLEMRIEELQGELDRVKRDLVDAMQEAERWKEEAQSTRRAFHRLVQKERDTNDKGTTA